MLEGETMKQHIKVTTFFHCQERTVEGEVIQWCQAIASFNGQYLQVPAVLVRQGDKVLTVLLQDQYTCTQISIWDEA